jgi:uncharacterized GH25 family protein
MDWRMNRLRERNNRGIASVFGIVLVLLLFVTLASALFISLYAYEEKAQESIDVEEERVQEKIVLQSLTTENISGTEYLKSLLIRNAGTITTRIRAIYVDNNFVCDPTNPSLNPYDTYINPKESHEVQLLNNLIYEPLSKIEVATERGVKAIEYEWVLRGDNQTDLPAEVQKVYFGPLLLDFNKFYYTEYDNFGDLTSWKPGWSVENSIEVVWNITVTNIDDRDITINKYSSFTLVKNAEGGQRPWFIEPPDELETLLIPSNTTVSILYIWDDPQSGSSQSVFNQNQECRVFMSFFGFFHEKDGSIKPYGQTIPFEAVLLRDPQIEISANPSVIATASSMTSTITVTVRDVMGLMAAYTQVNFTTTNGYIPPMATTDSNGVAVVTLIPGSTIGPAVVTATAEGASKSTTVEIVSGILTIDAEPSALAAGSTMNSTITARVTLNGNPVPGETVTFTTDALPSLGILAPTMVITDSQGYATVTLIPGTDTGSATITAEWGTLSGQTTINISSGDLMLSAESPLAADSTMNSTITARVTLNGNPVPGETVTFTTDALPSLGILSSTTAIANNQGEAYVTFTPGTDTGTTTITATWGTLNQSTFVTVSIADVSIQALPLIITANSPETSEITVHVLIDGTPVANASVTFATNSTQATLMPVLSQTDDLGIATTTLWPGTTSEYVEVTATWEKYTDSVIIVIEEGLS